MGGVVRQGADIAVVDEPEDVGGRGPQHQLDVSSGVGDEMTWNGRQDGGARGDRMAALRAEAEGDVLARVGGEGAGAVGTGGQAAFRAERGRLAELGVSPLRVRLFPNDVAVIETSAEWIAKLAQDGTREPIVDYFQSLGFSRTLLSLTEFRSGSMNMLGNRE